MEYFEVKYIYPKDCTGGKVYATGVQDFDTALARFDHCVEKHLKAVIELCTIEEKCILRSVT